MKGINDYPEMMTVLEVAEYLQISRSQVYYLVQVGELPSVRFGRMIRIPREALKRQLDEEVRACVGESA